jgi:serine/threonine protein kinase
MDDATLGKLLLEKGLLAQDEYEEAEKERSATGKPLSAVLVEKRFLSPVQLQDAVASLQKRVRFCPECRVPVYVPRLMEEGERCPRCLGPVQWQEEQVVAQIREVDTIVQLTKDELPSDVRSARTRPGAIFGKFILVEEVGRGGAGVVYKAWDTMLAEYVALKFIREQKRMAETEREAKKVREEQILDLLQEARAALRLRHPHIVALRDIGRIGEQFYLAMDFVEGRTLADHVKDSQKRGHLSPLYEDPAFQLGTLRDVSNALHYAHTFPKPIVHCDLKPGNILVSRLGTAYVMDFGLARVVGAAREDEGEEKVRGTPAYMAPEQLSGKNDAIGTWTDVYALGATLYELLAGRPVFTGEPVAILLQALRDTPERPTEVVRKTTEGRSGHESTKILMKISKLEEICLKCLAKEPKDRYPSARHVAEELATVLEAMELGRDTGMIPARVMQAQERVEIHRVDQHITSLNLDRAMAEAEALARKRDTTHVRLRLEERRQQVAFLEQFRARLVEQLNRQRPSLAGFKLGAEPLGDVEFLKATPKKVFLLAGDHAREAEWSAFEPGQIVELARTAGMESEEDRLALGILCHHARLGDLAVRFLTSLKGTGYQEAAARILESTA